MAKRRKQKENQDTLVNLVEAKEQAQDFFEANQNYLLGGLVALVVIIGGWFSYANFYQKPRQEEAVEQMREAERQFAQDSFALALDNPGNGYPGFLGIIDSYSGTKAANLAQYYAGISWLNLGEYEAAIAHLKDFNANGYALTFTKFGAMGDAYSELNDTGEAIKFYNKAVQSGDNEFLKALYLKKLALLKEKEGDIKGALEAYKRIKKDFPNTPDADGIEKYIERAEAKS